MECSVPGTLVDFGIDFGPKVPKQELLEGPYYLGTWTLRVRRSFLSWGPYQKQTTSLLAKRIRREGQGCPSVEHKLSKLAVKAGNPTLRASIIRTGLWDDIF